jgi:hypothetical protein
MKRIALGSLTATLFLAGLLPGWAHTKKSAAHVTLASVPAAGSTGAFNGSVSSPQTACVSRRIVVLSVVEGPDETIATGHSDAAGDFSVEGSVADGVTSVRAWAPHRTVKKTSGHSHVCRAVTSAAVAPAGGSSSIDLTALPVGDSHYSSSPQHDYIYSCQTSFNGGGASRQGPWFNGDGTWDLTKKLEVDGSVSWPHQLDVGLSGDTRLFSGNNLPEHPTGTFPIARSDDVYEYDSNPNSMSDQDVAFTLDATPTELSSPECAGGSVGYMLTGGYLFNGFDAGGRDAVAWEAQDACGGHPQNTGVYHYHALATCAEGASDGGHSDLMGYAFDGFGIYGHYGVDGELLTNDDLDACHGHTHEIEWDGTTKSMYHYHATFEFPYSVGCFRGDAIRVPAG